MFIDKLLEELEHMDVALANDKDIIEAVKRVQKYCKHRWAILEVHRSRLDSPQFCADCMVEKK